MQILKFRLLLVLGLVCYLLDVSDSLRTKNLNRCMHPTNQLDFKRATIRTHGVFVSAKINQYNRVKIFCAASSDDAVELKKSSSLATKLLAYEWKRPMCTALSTLAVMSARFGMFQLHAAVAAALVAYAVILISEEKYGPGAYSGCFAGMSGYVLCPGVISALPLAIMNAVMFELFEKYDFYKGYGGRLGFCAACSGVVVSIFYELLTVAKRGTFFTNAMRFPKEIVSTVKFCAANPQMLLQSWVVIFAAAMLTAWIRQRKQECSPVEASAIVTIISGAVYGGGIKATLTLLGSFIGMSAVKTPLSKDVPLLFTAAQAAVAAMAFRVLSRTLLLGVGGSVGSSAFLSFIIMNSIWSKMNKKKSQ